MNEKLVDKTLIQRIGVCTSCTKEECEHRIPFDGEPSPYNAAQVKMVHDYLCASFTQDGGSSLQKEVRHVGHDRQPTRKRKDC